MREHVVALLLAQGERFEAGHVLGLLGSQGFAFRQLSLEHLYLRSQALIDDDALVQGRARGLQPLDLDIFILRDNAFLIELLVNLDVGKESCLDL